MAGPADAADTQEIDRIRASSRRALLERDWDAWARDVADEFYGTTAAGTLRTKADTKRDHEAGTWAGLALDYDEIDVRVYGDLAVEVGRVRSKLGAGRYLLIFTRRRSGWQLVAWH